MNELERGLGELRLELPETPDLAPRVRARIEAEPRPERPAPRRVRPALVIALVLLLCGGALAASPLRDDVLDWLGIGGVEVKRVPELPPASGGDLDLGERVAPDRAGFEPSALGRPDAVYLRRNDPPGGEVALVYRPREGLPEADGTGVGLLLTRFRASDDFIYIEKSVGPGTSIDRIDVDGARGFFISGRPHTFFYADRDGQVREERIRLAGSTLLWESGGFTYRLEAEIPLEEAVRIAESVRETRP